jgi:hypothetical protein
MSTSKVRTVCGSSARTDLCGGPLVTVVPTAIIPLVCIHGTSPGAFGWGDFHQNIDQFREAFRTIWFDLPQYGRSDKPIIQGDRLTFTAKLIDAFLNALDISRAHFVGVSMGGYRQSERLADSDRGVILLRKTVLKSMEQARNGEIPNVSKTNGQDILKFDSFIGTMTETELRSQISG